jgi:hypothetical protein
MANISVGFGTDLSLKAIIKGIRIAIGTVNEDRINSPVKRKARQSRVEKDRAVRGAADIKEFIALLGEPHAVMTFVPVGGHRLIRSSRICCRIWKRAIFSLH